MKKSAFTLVEILIVVVLFGLLSGIILQTYTTITKVAFRMEQDKELAKETLILSQVLQNIAEEATIDYERYVTEKVDLKTRNGTINTLYLTGGQRTGTQIFSTGDCEKAGKLYDEKYRENKDQNADFSSCRLILQKGDDENNQFTLLGTGKFLQSEMQFKIIPYESTLQALESDTKAGKPGFWILGAVYSPFYDPQKRSNSSILPIQLFFGLHGATPNLYELNEIADEN